MRNFNNSNMARRVVRGGAIVLSAFALASCGSDSNKDRGTDKISQCPKNYNKINTPIEETVGSFDIRLTKAVGELISKMPVNRLGNYPSSLDNYVNPAEASKFVNAAEKIFYVNDGGDFLSENPSNDTFEVTNSETKIDDPSEQLCVKGHDHYIVPEAMMTIGYMRSAGVDTDLLLPPPRP